MTELQQRPNVIAGVLVAMAVSRAAGCRSIVHTLCALPVLADQGERFLFGNKE